MKNHYSDEQRNQFIDEFNNSGLSAREFAGTHNLKYTTFLEWLRKRKLKLSDNNMIEITNLLKREKSDEYINIKVNNYKLSVLKEDIRSFIEVLNND